MKIKTLTAIIISFSFMFLVAIGIVGVVTTASCDVPMSTMDAYCFEECRFFHDDEVTSAMWQGNDESGFLAYTRCACFLGSWEINHIVPFKEFEE